MSGAVELVESLGLRSWQVECPGHVAIRIKQVFPRAARSAPGKLRVAATPETCRDLEWFLCRYPMAMSDADRDWMAAQAGRHREAEALVAEVSRPDYVPPEIPLAIPLRPYQLAAVDLYLRSRSLLVGDDVGLGKTAVAIGSFADPRTLPAVVVTLSHLPRQWAAEIGRFLPGLKVRSARTGDPADLGRRKGDDGRPADVTIVNYHKLRRLAPKLAETAKSVVYDEIQELRRNESEKYRSASVLSEAATFRLGLSATPIYNYGGEMFNVLDAIRPGSLGTQEEFLREWCVQQSASHRLRDPAAFGSYLKASGLMIRRTREEVGRELPRVLKIPHEIDCDLREIDRVADKAAELARVILAQGGRARGEQLRASEELSNKLRQATGIAKARPVADFVRMLAESGEKVVLFGWHREVYSIWAESLKDLRPVFYTGTESPTQKAKAAGEFTDGTASVMVISLRAGAGLDGLQLGCKTVVFGELDWSPGVHEQCIGRIHRDGQAAGVNVYYLLSDSGSDPIVSDVLGLKKQQIEGVINPDAPGIERLEVDPGHIKRLAADFLERRGLSVGPEVELCSTV